MKEFPAEWYPQSAVQLTWPDASTDWKENLDEVIPVYVEIIKELQTDQIVVVVCQDTDSVSEVLKDFSNLKIVKSDLNDTWARDHGGISVIENGRPVLLDFGFNAWGNKFTFHKDNDITRKMYEQGVFEQNVEYVDCLDFILEGGSVESDGKGTVLTTSDCLLSPERNPSLTKNQIEDQLYRLLGAKNVLWLENGYLAGDDTDSHIDTLARFVDEQTIAYVSCTDENDEHFEALKAMEEELKSLRQDNGEPYRLLALPMAEPAYDGEDRLPATYANFLIANKKVLVPFYGSSKDMEAKAVLEKQFPDRAVVGINCFPLIKQHGSLHCITMQYPIGFVRLQQSF